ncbi:MAG: hypothetical protein JXA64_07955 [Candidatus Fermentibacteraceae bacterium]|nr:hypothetical protein [Candidatus Fermentibacteraceae bacterium]MBN2609032.1 hypothetical protein [Candidatus Fermentibacteraceae bacterium]
MRSCSIAFALAALLLSCSCGGDGNDGSGSTDRNVSLYAGKDVSVELTLPAEEYRDSLLYHDGMPVELLLVSESSTSTFSAILVPECGSTPADRMLYLSGSDVKNLDSCYVDPRGDITPFTAVVYVSDDSSIVERVWDRGGGELVILQVRSMNTSLNILLASVSGILSTAGLSTPDSGLHREVHLSDRTRSGIVLEVNADVAVPPEITHVIELSVNPSEKKMDVLDTLTIDFSTTQSDSQLMMFVPRCEDGTSFQALSGSLSNCGDSVVCLADSDRIFRGVYSGSWNGFMSSTSDRITAEGMRIDRSMSFQCGMWFYPGCGIPSVYVLRVAVPSGMGYNVYAPLDEISRSTGDSVLTVSYLSPGGGIKGPLAWAAGGFTQHPVADGRSLFVCPDSDSTDAELTGLADYMTGVLWRNFGYDGARLDIIIVNVLDFPVLVTGPGCVFMSRGMMEGVLGYESWVDSLSAGVGVPSTSIVFETARAFLAGSTYLSENLRDALAAWAVCRFIVSADPESAPELMTALRKYYLYSTDLAGGVEYAIADPMLRTSGLYEPVILGKAPMVLEFLSHEIPAFERAVPRALGNLRHSGDSFGRLFSAMGLMESSRSGEMFFRWLYDPGLPLLEVEWSDSAEVLEIRVRQLQPGLEFPLGDVMEQVAVMTATGLHWLDTVQGAGRGLYVADLSDLHERVLSLDIDPRSVLPADIVYRHSRNEAGGI